MPVTVVTGPPGTGKSTVAALLARSWPLAVHLAPDACFHWIALGFVTPRTPGSDRQSATAIDAVGAAAGRFATAGYTVVIDGIVGPWFLGPLRRAVGHQPGGVGYVVLRPSRTVALRRACERTGPSDLTAAKPVQAMCDTFAELGPCERDVVDSSEQDLAATAHAVQAGLSAGRFALPDDDLLAAPPP